MYYFGTGHEIQNSREQATFVVLSFLFFLLGSYLLTFVVTSKVILRSDSIELKDILTSRALQRTDIAGRRMVPTRYNSTLVLVPHLTDQKKLRIPLYVEIDPAFQDWLNTIPDLDAEDLAKSESEIEMESDVGLSPEARSERFRNARKASTALNWIAGVASVWGWLFPRPYEVAIAVLALIPISVIALLMSSKGLFQIEGRRNDARPSLATPFIFPGAVLALRAIEDLHFLEWPTMLLATALLSVIVGMVAIQADHGIHNRMAAILPVVLFAAMYCYGLIAQLDVLLDRSRPTTYHPLVVEKRASHGKSGTTYYLQVDPWGPRRDTSEIVVRRSAYDSVSPGQTVTIDLFPGALKFPWYSASAGAIE